jgi:chorismate-pyruvate lyase
VKDGVATCRIVIAADATSSAKAAAQELQYHLMKMTGATAPIVTDEDTHWAQPAYAVCIGPSALTEKAGADLSNLPKEGFVIRNAGHVLVIAGDDSDDRGPAENAFFDDQDLRTGTLFGVYALLQDQLGCRWIWPGESGEIIPKRATVELPEADVKDGPALIRRSFRILQNRDLMRPWPAFFERSGVATLRQDQRVWARRMRLGHSANPQMDSPFTTWWQRYHSKYPEIFALNSNGTRDLEGGNLWRVHMCVSNPKLWELQIEWFKKTRRRFPDRHDVGASETGRNTGYCTCENCRAWDATTENLPKEVLDALDPDLVQKLKPGRDGLPQTLATRYARYYNELARRVREIDPEGFVTARPQFTEPPMGVKLEPNILTRFDGLGDVPATPEELADARGKLRDWTPPDGMVMLRLNTPVNSDNGMPFNVARELSDNLSFGLKNGAWIVDINAMLGHWASWGPTYYVLTRMMWQGADADPEALMNEWYAAFGPAEKAVRDYYDFWERHNHEVWTRPGERRKAVMLGDRYNMRSGGQILLIAEHYPPEVLAEARGLLQAAFAASEDADDAVRERLRMIEISLANANLTAEATRRAMDAYEDDAKTPALEGALKKLAAYRQEVWPTPAINVFVQTREEMGRRDTLRWGLIERPAEEEVKTAE